MRLGGLDPLRMDFGRTTLGKMDAAGAFLGKSGILDPLDIFGGRKQEKQEAAARAEARTERERQEAKEKAEAEKREKIAGLVFCPKGSKPNPEYMSVPMEARGQAAAAGIPQCIPSEGEGVDAKDLKKCYFQAGARKYPCDQDGASRAAAHARALAKKGGKPRYVLFITGQTITLARCIMPIPMAPTAAVPGAIPATPATAAALALLPPGQFQCPAGQLAARNAQNQVVCVDAATVQRMQAAGQMPAAKKPGKMRKAPRGAATSRRRGRRGMRDFLGETPPMETMKAKLRDVQKFLRLLRIVDERGRPVNVTGALDERTISAINLYQLAAGRFPPGAPGLTAGEILIGIDTIRGHLLNDILSRKRGLEGACIAGTCGSQGLGASMRTVVTRNLRRYGGPAIPGYMLRRGIPHAQFRHAPVVVQPNLATYACPQGYFPTQQGCVAHSAFTSGTGFPAMTAAGQVRQSLRPYRLGPNLPAWMLKQQVPPGGSMWAAR